jgi:hypothetical protein
LLKTGCDLAGSVRKQRWQGAGGDGGTLVNGGTGKLWLLAGLEADIVQQRGFGDQAWVDSLV